MSQKPKPEVCERCGIGIPVINNMWLGRDNPIWLCNSCAREWSRIYFGNDLAKQKNDKFGRKLFRKFLGEKLPKERVLFI